MKLYKGRNYGFVNLPFALGWEFWNAGGWSLSLGFLIWFVEIESGD